MPGKTTSGCLYPMWVSVLERILIFVGLIRRLFWGLIILTGWRKELSGIGLSQEKLTPAGINRSIVNQNMGNGQLKKKFGLTLDVYEAILEHQGGVCAICGKAETMINSGSKRLQPLAVDHCHKTGRVRGLLCAKCNHALGNFDDSTALLRRAIKYLERAK